MAPNSLLGIALALDRADRLDGVARQLFRGKQVCEPSSETPHDIIDGVVRVEQQGWGRNAGLASPVDLVAHCLQGVGHPSDRVTKAQACLHLHAARHRKSGRGRAHSPRQYRLVDVPEPLRHGRRPEHLRQDGELRVAGVLHLIDEDIRESMLQGVAEADRLLERLLGECEHVLMPHPALLEHFELDLVNPIDAFARLG